MCSLRYLRFPKEGVSVAHSPLSPALEHPKRINVVPYPMSFFAVLWKTVICFVPSFPFQWPNCPSRYPLGEIGLTLKILYETLHN